MSHVFPRHCKSSYPVAVRGDGCYVIDKSGKRYFDGSGGAAVSCLGHSNEQITEAIKSQVDKIAFAHTGFFTSQPTEALADLLVEHAPQGIDKVYFVSGGSEAVESAIKLARQYYCEKGQTNRAHLIARRQSYHGNTLGALAVGGNAWRRQQFSPLLINVSHIAPCYEYADRNETESLEQYGQRVAQELEDEIVSLGAENVIGFLAEPVVGATLGAVAAVPGYFKRVREICDQYDVLLILDEVMCGMGRTGRLFACETDDVAPDIVCIAKGLGAGYQPIGAMMCTAEIYQCIESGSGFFQHGHTYMGHPTATAAAHAVVSQLTQGTLLENVNSLGLFLLAALQKRFGEHPNIGNIRGRGLFIGLEFVEDKKTKQPFPAEKQIAGRLKKAAFDAGLICYPMPGTRNGKEGDHVLLAPPFIATESELLTVVDMLELAINETLP